MSRSAGWSVLAKEALELSALALAVRLMEESPTRASTTLSRPSPSIPQDDMSLRSTQHDTSLRSSVIDTPLQERTASDTPMQERDDAEVCHGEPVEPRSSLSRPAQPQLTPLAFIQETADPRTRLYSARDERGSIYAAFYADGRLRVAFEDHRLAGIVQNGHAHLLDMNSELWSEVFVRVTPEGKLQLELRDGPLDGRVLTCEALQV